MAVHLAPIIIHIRGYVNSIDVSRPLHEMTDDYLYHIVAVINDIGVCRLEGYDCNDGEGISHSDRRELACKLRSYGVKRVEWRHNGIEKHYNLVKL